MVYDKDMRAEKAKTYFPPPNTIKYIISKQSLKNNRSHYITASVHKHCSGFYLKKMNHLSSRKSFESVVEIVLEIYAYRLLHSLCV